MKRIIALMIGVCACFAAFTGCAKNDNVDSNSISDHDSSLVGGQTDEDQSKSLPRRAESAVDDIIDGGKRVVDDTVSTADDVVDNMTK